MSVQLLATYQQYVQERIIRIRELEKLTGTSRSMIYLKMCKTSKYYDSSFPRSRKLGTGHAVGWLLSEVMNWIESLK